MPDQAYDFRRSRPPAWRFARPTAQGAGLAAAMAADGRSVSSSGNFKTRPGAPMSAYDSSSDAPVGPGVSGGFTDDSTWNNFFHSKPDPSAVPGATWAQPNAWNGRGPKLAPDSPAAISDIAVPDSDPSWAGKSRPDPSNPSSYLDATMNSQDKYFNALGQPIARPRPGAVQSGTSIQSQYGSASVVNAKIPPLPELNTLINRDNPDSYTWPDNNVGEYGTDLPT